MGSHGTHALGSSIWYSILTIDSENLDDPDAIHTDLIFPFFHFLNLIAVRDKSSFSVNFALCIFVFNIKCIKYEYTMYFLYSTLCIFVFNILNIKLTFICFLTVIIRLKL